MENIKRVLSYTRRAVDDYEMIRDGDKIAAVPFVGISDTYSIKKEKKCCNALTIIFYLY